MKSSSCRCRRRALLSLLCPPPLRLSIVRFFEERGSEGLPANEDRYGAATRERADYHRGAVLVIPGILRGSFFSRSLGAGNGETKGTREGIRLGRRGSRWSVLLKLFESSRSLLLLPPLLLLLFLRREREVECPTRARRRFCHTLQRFFERLSASLILFASHFTGGRRCASRSSARFFSSLKGGGESCLGISIRRR